MKLHKKALAFIGLISVSSLLFAPRGGGGGGGGHAGGGGGHAGGGGGHMSSGHTGGTSHSSAIRSSARPYSSSSGRGARTNYAGRNDAATRSQASAGRTSQTATNARTSTNRSNTSQRTTTANRATGKVPSKVVAGTRNAQPVKVSAAQAKSINTQAKSLSAPRSGTTSRRSLPQRFGRNNYAFYHNGDRHIVRFYNGYPYHWYNGYWSPWADFWGYYPWWYDYDLEADMLEGDLEE